MITVFQLLSIKGSTVHTIDKSSTVFDAIAKMVENNVGALVVTTGSEPCGIVTERDYLRKIALVGRSSRTTRVEEIMSNELISVRLHTNIERCMELMTRNRIRHLPVFEEGRLEGVVSIGDIVKHLARDRQEQIEQLTAYIQGAEMAPIAAPAAL